MIGVFFPPFKPFFKALGQMKEEEVDRVGTAKTLCESF